MAEFIRLDLFPATVTVGEQVLTPARAVVTDDAVHVYMDSRNGPEDRYTARLADFDGARNIGYIAETDDGEKVHIQRASGCGCGSRLRGFKPFPGVPIVRTK